MRHLKTWCHSVVGGDADHLENRAFVTIFKSGEVGCLGVTERISTHPLGLISDHRDPISNLDPGSLADHTLPGLPGLRA